VCRSRAWEAVVGWSVRGDGLVPAGCRFAMCRGLCVRGGRRRRMMGGSR